MFNFGQRDEKRFASLVPEQRDYLIFLTEFCREILKRRPEHLEALSCAANALTALGYYEEGLKLDIKLRELRSDDAGVAYNLACSLALTGQHDAALAALAAAINLGFDDIQHMCHDPDLEALRNLAGFRELIRQARRGAAAASSKAAGDRR